MGLFQYRYTDFENQSTTVTTEHVSTLDQADTDSMFYEIEGIDGLNLEKLRKTLFEKNRFQVVYFKTGVEVMCWSYQSDGKIAMTTKIEPCVGGLAVFIEGQQLDVRQFFDE